MRRRNCSKTNCCRSQNECPTCCNQVIRTIVGPTGPTGATGPSGETILVRSTTTLDAGNNARVDTSHIGNTTYLDFYIPKGEMGQTETILVGETRAIKSDRPAKVEDRFEDGNHYLDFYIPQGETGEKGEKGDIGPQGERGEKGNADKLDIACVYTIDFNEPARVEDDEENGNHHLSVYIPRGIQGERGEIGPKGDTGAKGDKGEIGPKGDKGNTGPAGEKGIAEGISIDGAETVASTEKAQVLDDFEQNIHHLTFYIPKGEKGERGAEGQVGPAGPAGPPGATTNINATIYSTTALSLTNGTALNLDKTLTNNRLTVQDGKIVVANSGTYIISYSINSSANAIVGETIAVSVNDIAIVSTKRPIPNDKTTSAFIVMRLEKNSTVSLVPTITQSLTLSATDAPSATLTVINIA